MFRFVMAAAAAICLLSGCASSGTKVDPAKVQAFQRGKTSYAEVTGALGAPQADALADDGTRIVTYSYAHAQARAVDFIPYVGLFAGGADAKVTGYTFTFDKDGILVSYASVSGQNSVNTGLFNSGH